MLHIHHVITGLRRTGISYITLVSLVSWSSTSLMSGSGQQLVEKATKTIRVCRWTMIWTVIVSFLSD